MALSKFLFSILIVTICLPVFGQSKFLQECEIKKASKNAEYGWLKHHFQSEECSEIAKGLSKVKSFNDFFPPFEKELPHLPGSWTNAFPEIYGLKSKLDHYDVSRALRGYKINYNVFFKTPELFSEFKNITMIDFSLYFYKDRVCEILKKLPHIKTAIIDLVTLNEISECGPVETLPELIVVRDHIGSGKEKVATRIIGLENFSGRTTDLNNYPNLRYIGFGDFFGDIRGLISNQNITHLAINATAAKVENISDLAEMPNLSYLSLTCIKNIYEYRRNHKTKIETCDEQYLSDIDFIINFDWMEHVNFSHNALKDVSPLGEMKELISINVSNNQIQEFPDFSGHKKLKVLNTSDNPGNPQ